MGDGSANGPTNGRVYPEEEPTGNLEPVDGLCNGKNRFGRYCPKDPMIGKTRCYHHGGMNRSGIASPNFKHGRWSKSLPDQLALRYDALVNDGEIINLSQDIALLDVRVTQLMERLDQKESEAGWSKARATFEDLKEALAEQDATASRSALLKLSSILSANTGVDATWRDIREALQERRLLVESERRRLVDMNQMVTVEQLLILVARISGIVNRYVPEDDRRHRIASEVAALLGPGGGQAAQMLARAGTAVRHVPAKTRSVTRNVPPADHREDL